MFFRARHYAVVSTLEGIQMGNSRVAGTFAWKVQRARFSLIDDYCAVDGPSFAVSGVYSRV
jgi:hypothetical protein